MAQSTKNLTAAIRAPFWRRFGLGKTRPSNLDHAFDNDYDLQWENAAGNAAVPVLKVNTSDEVEFAGGTTVVGARTWGDAQTFSGGVTFSSGATLANGQAVNWVNAAGNGGISVLAVGANDIPTLLNGARVTAGAQLNASVLTRRTVGVAIATAGDETYTTTQLLGGLITRDTAGGPRADTLPAAADLVAAITGAAVGDSFDFIYHNNSGAANASTLTAPDAAVTIVGTAAIAQNEIKRITVVITNVTAAAEAYSVYIPS